MARLGPGSLLGSMRIEDCRHPDRASDVDRAALGVDVLRGAALGAVQKI